MITGPNYSGMYPIKIAGVTVKTGVNKVPDSSDDVVCTCTKGTVVQTGVTASFNNFDRVIESVAEPYCLPLLGITVAEDVEIGGWGKNAQGNPPNEQTDQIFSQGHYWLFPTGAVLDILRDVACLDGTGGVDLGYLSELDITWADDELSVLVFPEAAAFSSMPAQLACVADAATSLVGFALAPMIHCIGSAGSVFPVSGRISNRETVEANHGLAAKVLYSMCRSLMVCDPGIAKCLCVFTPIWIKWNYFLQAGKPNKQAGVSPIGRSSVVWGMGVNQPVEGDDFLFVLFRHHICCMF